MSVLVEAQGSGVTLVTLNKPKTLNSMNLGDVGELSDALAALAGDETCRVVIITGAGRGFCSGHELDEMQVEFSVESALKIQETFAALTIQLRNMPQATIAAVNGPAAGGGLALALACDTRVCTVSARFNAAFVRLGISGCDVGVSYLLPKIVGPSLAFEMMLSGRLVPAEEALRSGLVLSVHPDGEVIDAAREIACSICANAPFAVRMTKEVMWANLDAPSLQAAVHLENRTQILCALSPDYKAVVDAFVARLGAK